MKTLTILVALVVGLIGPVNAQKKKKLPGDLDNQKIIFLQYEKLPIDDSYPKGLKKYYENVNEVVERKNPKLVQYAKNYPFEYIISQRAHLPDLKEQGHKYVLNSDLMEAMNNGTFMPQHDIRYYTNMYIEDLQSGKKYILFKQTQGDMFDFKEIMSRLVKIVKKEYSLK